MDTRDQCLPGPLLPVPEPLNRAKALGTRLLFDSLIMSIFTFAIELWGCAYDGKYLSQIDKFIKRAHKNGYISKRSHIKEIRDKRDKKLWNKITSTENNALLELLPEKSRLLRPRGHAYELPLVRTERFKRSFINRCMSVQLCLDFNVFKTF